MARTQLRWNTGSETARPQSGTAPDAPTAVTSITADASATVSFLPPASSGSSSVTSYTVTPYIAGSPQSPTTIAAGSTGSLVGSNGSTYRQMTVSGLTNSTAYTFTVKAANASGTGVESAASGANTPLSGLVFGDDFNGSAGGAIDPEWWVYNRCGYLSQSEVQYYLPEQVTLDGSGNLLLTATHTSYTGPGYPSGGGGSVTQAWRSGACQSNARTFLPTVGNTMTFETRFQTCADAGGTMWPGLLWLEGQAYLDAWKTDPAQSGWDDSGKAEIDIAEWNQTGLTGYYNNVATGTFNTHGTSGPDASAAMHVYSCQWKPTVSTKWFRDGSQTNTDATSPSRSNQFFLLLYLQILAGTAASPQSCVIDYVRVFDQNLG